MQNAQITIVLDALPGITQEDLLYAVTRMLENAPGLRSTLTMVGLDDASYKPDEFVNV